MGNRFIGKDTTLSERVNQVIDEKLHLTSPSIKQYFGLNTVEEARFSGVGAVMHKSSERIGDPNGRLFVAGVSRWGSSHVVG